MLEVVAVEHAGGERGGLSAGRIGGHHDEPSDDVRVFSPSGREHEQVNVGVLTRPLSSSTRPVEPDGEEIAHELHAQARHELVEHSPLRGLAACPLEGGHGR